ncbi:MAG: biotin/lipoyl-binding protein, partial [Oscillospiraceae bacterium]|nr:biotin/lipoyl-binding protein [Oscillospiraceae bacterium]
MSKKKKWVLAILIPALAAGAVFGTYGILRANREPAKVYAVRDISMDDYGYYDPGSYFNGQVQTDRLQPVYLSPTQEVTEILVFEGDRVQKGDPLIRFNTTLSELELQQKSIDIQKAQDELDRAQRSYKRYFGEYYTIPPAASGQTRAQGLSVLPGRGAKLTLLAAPVFRSESQPPEPVTE